MGGQRYDKRYELDPPWARSTLENMSFWWCVGSFWYNLPLLDSVLSNEGNVLIREHQVIEIMWLFPFHILVWIHGYDIFLTFYNKVDFILEQATKAQRGSKGLTLLFLWPRRLLGWVVSATPRRFTPGKETLYPLYKRLGVPQGRSGRLRNISPPPKFHPRIFQAVASRYADYAIPAPGILQSGVLYNIVCFYKK